MAKINEQFEYFLTNINPDKQAIEYASEAHTRVREHLEQQDRFKEFVLGSFLYGSYKRHTAVGDIKDVDVVILTNFDTKNEENTPEKVLRKLKAALARCYNDPENPQYQRRSIRVDDPLPDKPDALLTLDIIPAVNHPIKDNVLLVPDREQRKWICSNPRGHLEHTTKLNSHSKEQFVPLVKIMKWWWRYQCDTQQPDVERPKPKGFWIECLTGVCFDYSQKNWADHFIKTLTNIVELCRDLKIPPTLHDPGLPANVIKTNISETEFQFFKETAETSLNLAIKARDEEDKLSSSELWQEILGDAFPLYDHDESNDTRKAALEVLPSDSSHAQKLLYQYLPDKKYKVALNAYVYKKIGDQYKCLSGINSGGRILSSNMSLKFIAKTKAKGNYEVIWQVVNTGRHAQKESGLRGDFFKAKTLESDVSSNPLINWEITKYDGCHWIECFIIKNNVCVARSGKFEVKVSNKNW